MLIIRPYGRSETVLDWDSPNLRRILRPRPFGDGWYGIPEFAGGYPEQVMKEWVSVIDKIADRKSPTREWRALRDELGRAAWNILEHKVPAERAAELRKLWWRKLWWRKIRPYDEGGDERGSGWEKGRWYNRFVGKTEPGAVGPAEAAKIARRIKEHLHEREYRICGGPDKRQGLIPARAESIAGNVAALVCELPQPGWTDEDCDRYRDAADVAGEIRREAEAVEAESRRVDPTVAAKVLHAHYPRLFAGADGQPLSAAQARKEKPGLFALHGAVREVYTRVLKNHGKDRWEHGTKRRRVSTLLPWNMDALFAEVKARRRNRELCELVRLGKLIHYEVGLAGDEGDKLDFTAVERSRYWTSAGQTEIKRNEDFVGVWRGAVALAQRTLTGWADPDSKTDKDIFIPKTIKQALGDGFDQAAYSAKLRLLFGARAGIFEKRAEGRAVLRFALEGWRELRNNAFHFHFVGRGGFVHALRQGLEAGETPIPNEVSAAVRELFRQDHGDRRPCLIASLRGAQVEHYFRQEQIEALLGVVVAAAGAGTPLPRFRRVLSRAENAWRRGKFRLNLPRPESRRTMETAPSLRARYVILKALYERAFPAWLERQAAAVLNDWISRAETRATEAAQEINHDMDAAARMAGLIRLKDVEGIADFTDRLAAEKVSEFRVQRGYRSDPDSVRKKARHLENLNCDVVAQAFETYLKAEALDWALRVPAHKLVSKNANEPKERPEKKADLEIASRAAPGAGPTVEYSEDWHAKLYFLIHLLPMETVADLRHQLRKWAAPEGKADADVAAVEGIFGLYLDMHDAKFEGGEGAAEAIKGLFESESLFRQVCPETSDANDGSHVPWRDLREMLRFDGREPRLMGVFEQHPISAAMVKALDELEVVPGGGVSPVAAAHARREKLHAEWIEQGRKFCDGDKLAYREALNTVVASRHLANHVRLVNHAWLHRLAIKVLARLADYAGRWERDLYFTTLAIIWLRRVTPAEVFAPHNLELLKKGQIVQALRDKGKGGQSDSDHKVSVRAELDRLFGEDIRKANIRNRLALFYMLRSSESKPVNLTAAVNDARRLMAYDRKLKNAVSRSVIELLARENLNLAWGMNGKQELHDAQLSSRCAVHLGDRKITEDLHGQEFVAMAAELFDGAVRPSTDAIPAGKAARHGDSIPVRRSHR